LLIRLRQKVLNGCFGEQPFVREPQIGGFRHQLCSVIMRTLSMICWGCAGFTR
jgi:hypothetical protein